MNQRERDVYDAYPRLLVSLVEWAGDVTKLPLDEMMSASERMALTNAFIGPQSSQRIDTQTLLDHQELIDLARDFRRKYIELALKTQRTE